MSDIVNPLLPPQIGKTLFAQIPFSSNEGTSLNHIFFFSLSLFLSSLPPPLPLLLHPKSILRFGFSRRPHLKDPVWLLYHGISQRFLFLFGYQSSLIQTSRCTRTIYSTSLLALVFIPPSSTGLPFHYNYEGHEICVSVSLRLMNIYFAFLSCCLFTSYGEDWFLGCRTEPIPFFS